MKPFTHTALLILDGWGQGQNPAADAIAQAKTPFMDNLYQQYPHAQLVTYGEAVGLPEGQMGNSEVGHLNLGAGRIVYQELARINKEIRDKTLDTNPVLLQAIQTAKNNRQPFHLLGLVSDGGVHAHIEHLKALCDILVAQGLEQVYIHAILDGRDTDPHSGVHYLQDLLAHIQNTPVQLASVIGRYYAMDRDKRWERIQLAYELLTQAKGSPTTDPIAALKASYAQGVTDEFILPIVCTQTENAQPIAKIQAGEVVLCFNFRTDRGRQITTALTQTDFPDFGMQKLDLHYYTMTRYDETYKGVQVLYEKEDLSNTLGEILSKHDKLQTRIAETEKYPHVTFFFSGGQETPFNGENRLIIPSPKVATYDLAPEMSAREITQAITQEIAQRQPHFICLNYANADMVGHTGVFEAAKQAVSTVDNCLSDLVPQLLEKDYAIIIIADHGNSDMMINPDGSPNTAHTKNPVPCIFVSNRAQTYKVENGKLADIAPTILSLMQLPIPAQMNGEVIIQPTN